MALQEIISGPRDRAASERQTRRIDGRNARAVRGRVALVDDEPLFREALSQNLRDAGFETTEFESGPAMLAYLSAKNPVDLIILDWKMPKMNGIDVLKRLRSAGHHLPVIFLTGLSHQVYEEAALTGGAVDFIEKSRGFAILLKRTEMRLKQAQFQGKRLHQEVERLATGTLSIGQLDLCLDANRAYWRGKEVNLTLSEFKMVRLLAEQAGEYIAYRRLYDLARGKASSDSDGDAGIEMNMRTFIKRIRQGFVSIDARFDLIENYAKFGYRWRKEQPAG
jgi:two-component system response regulator ChvI